MEVEIAMDKERSLPSERDGSVIPNYVDRAMGIPVVLKDSVRKAQFEGEQGILVPDLKGLEAAMAVARAMIDHKLNGHEIRFLRKALELKAVDLAEHLDVTPETLSRWENGKDAISTNAERLLRLRVVRALREKAPGVPATLDDVLDMKFLSVRVVSEPATMMFKRLLVLGENKRTEQHVWCFRGVIADHQEAETKRIA